MVKYVQDREIYNEVVLQYMLKASQFLWLATADIKDMHVDHNGKMISFLDVLSELVSRKVEIRLLHAKEPGKAFRRDFDKNRNLIKGMEMILCPRVHMKTVIVDGKFAYSGSANITGAGMGAKNENKRNFESGFITDEPAFIDKVMDQFDKIWMGVYCRDCRRREYCSSYMDLV